jgi:lipoate-protein ligase A
MDRFEIIQDRPREAQCHMAIDRALVANGAPHPSLRVYEWAQPAITAGLFSKPERLITPDQHFGDIVTRPTGGGILFHDTDLICAVFIPKSSAIAQVCETIIARLHAALAHFLPPFTTTPVSPDMGATRFCMAQNGATDLFWNGKKIGGCAQRKSRAGILHQTSLFLHTPDWENIAVCVKDPDDVLAMKTASTSLEMIAIHPIDRQLIREAVAEQFTGGFA